MKYKEDMRIVRTRKHLSSTIIQMMQTMPIDKISVIDICKEAIVNRATFYAHFEDKYHLLSFALEELKDEIFASKEYSSLFPLGLNGVQRPAENADAGCFQFVSIVDK